MNNNLLNVIKEIVEKNGDSILSEPKRVSAFLADLAQDEPKPHKNALVKCLEHGFTQTLKDIPENERGSCKQQLAQKLHDEEGLDLGLCGETLELLALVLFGEERKKILCKNCGKELQEEWKSCPYCGTSGDTNSEDGQSDEKLKEAKGENDQLHTELTKTNSKNEQLSNELGNAKYEIEQLKEKLKKTKNGLITVIVLAIIGVIIVGIVINDKNNLYDYANSRANNLQNRVNALQKDYENAKAISKIIVTGISVGNTDSDNKWLTNPGDNLQSSQIRYLTPVITYDSTINEDVTFSVKIINPYGTLHTGTSSPSGYTFSDTLRVNRGNGQSLKLSGWGNSDSSSYSAGQYTVEVWYNNVLLKSEKVTISP